MAGDGVSVKVSTNDRSEAAASSGVSFGSASGTWGIKNGDWVVNVPNSAGDGLTLQGGASGGVKWWLLFGLGFASVMAARYLLKRR